MRGDIIKREIIFECQFLEGDCKYGNPLNKRICDHCYFGKIIKTKLKDFKNKGLNKESISKAK